MAATSSDATIPTNDQRTTTNGGRAAPVPRPIHLTRLAYPEQLERWKPLYQWFLAIPQYFVLAGLFVAACLGIVAGSFVVLLTGEYPEAIRDFLVSAYRYALRVEAYVGLLTDRYPPFNFAA